MINLSTGNTLQGGAGSATSITYTITGMELASGVETYKVFNQGQVSASPGILYGPVAASTQAFVKTIHLQNTTASAVAVDFYINGTAATNRIHSISIPSNGSAIFNQEGWTVYDSAGLILYTSPTVLTGDVTGSGAGTIPTTIAANVVDNTKLSDMAQATFKMRAAGAGTGDPIDGTPAQAKTALAITSTDLSDFTEGAQDAVGAALTDTATIDTTYNDGANTMTFDLKTNSVANSLLAQMPTRTIKGNNTGGTANALDLTVLQVQAMLDVSVFSANEVGILTSNTGAQNVTAFNAWYATAPTFCTLYFAGSGFYDFNAELTLNRDIRIRFLGCGKGRSILRTTSATANLFNQTVAGFYISWEELGFVSTVTNRTAGAAIRLAGNNAVCDVRRCEFQNQFNGIELANNTALNVGVINECIFNTPSTTAGSDTDGAQIKINGSNINMMIQNCTINVTGTSTTGLMVNQSGAVQVSACDFIGGKNTLLVNATAVVSALYFSNVFFDQATFGSTVKFMGTSAISRVKFSQCGITNGGTSGLVACEIAGTGTGTGIPEAIDFIQCDFYNNGFAGTTTGLLVTGCRGFDVRNCRVAGFTVGIDVTSYNGNDITNFGITGNTIGPTENFAGNGTGIRINAGSFAYGRSHITNNDLSGNTTAPINLTTATFTNNQLLVKDNIGLIAAPLGTAPGTVLPLTTITKAGSSVLIPANAVRAGNAVRITAQVTNTATIQTTTVHVKYGTADTNADASLITAALGAGTAALGGARIEVTVHFLSATSAIATYSVFNNGAAGFTNVAVTNNSNTAPIAITSTANNFLALYLASSVASIVTIRAVEYEIMAQ